ncbi:MAG: hypothetical protein M0037_14730 [Betaproteobacteria bacterium]|nr:hypothetical protein [Betaproteobacteria bacterium]
MSGRPKSRAFAVGLGLVAAGQLHGGGARADTEIHVSAAEVASATVVVHDLRGELRGPLGAPRLKVHIGSLVLSRHRYRNVALRCSGLHLAPQGVRCARGQLFFVQRMPLAFQYSSMPRRLKVVIAPARGESWGLDAQFRTTGWQAVVDVRNGRLERLSPWLGSRLPHPTGGRVTGRLSVLGDGAGAVRLGADVRLAQAAFSDASGLHAGDKLSGSLHASAVRVLGRWAWSARVDYRQGEVFWQPFYLAKGGAQLDAEGTWGPQAAVVSAGRLAMTGVGSARFSGRWNRLKGRLQDLDVQASKVQLAQAYPVFVQPFYAGTALGNLVLAGEADVRWRYQDGRPQQFDLVLRGASAADKSHEFAFQGIAANIPWSRVAPTAASIRIKQGRVFSLPLGSMDVPLALKGTSFRAPRLTIPILNGQLAVNSLYAERGKNGWAGGFSGTLSPLSMADLTRALKLPVMHGDLSGVIPEVTYRQGRLALNGALLVRVFDGSIAVTHLALQHPLGPAPQLQADLYMHRLDLGLLTRAFSFGSIQGRIDATVDHLDLVDWRPVAFDARIASSPGHYVREISQRAVQNITALGGASPSAVLERGFLGFFKQFRYRRIGLSCILRNGICKMNGIKEVPNGYVIVEGGGIPAITVIGYNHFVDWDVLIDRLKRIAHSQGPIVR